jgi:DNA helicase-2/ATP-dependent DNA helicase PcrA
VTTPLSELLANLDERQRRAATLGPGPAQIIAPAGSGKTATLVARVGVLLEAGVPGPRILAVTFNRDAAMELGQRITAALGVAPGGDGPEVRTLHALARQVVLDGPRPPRLVADRLPLLRHARRQVLATISAGEGLPRAEELDAVVSAAILEEKTPAGLLAEVVEAYQRILAIRGAIDFDGLLAEALGRLRRDPALRARWQARFSHVLVDEFQDVDATQAELVALLAEPERNLFVVGDDDQTIYAWRLADVRRILEFPTRYPDATRVVLETNYRCPPVVVAAADRLISTNRERVPKRLRAAPRPHPRPGQRPLLTWPYRGPDAADRLAAILPDLAAEGGRVAVLARTRAELGPVILSLLRAGIPHATNVAAPLDAEPVVALVDELRAAEPTRPPVPLLLRQRVARGWSRGDPSDALGEDAHLALDAALGWAVGHPRTASYLAAFDEARVRLASLRDPDAPIELATVHGTKGREWPIVVVLGMELDRFPNKRSLTDALDPARALEEERRLAYVAVTRCRDRLILAFDPDRPSPFIAELMGQAAPGLTVAYRPTSSATTSR